MPSPKRKIGDMGEEIVVRYLENKGFVVLERNYWKPWGEIDIVAKRGSILRFIEVKAISRGTLRPEENMHPRKVQRLRRALQTYLLDRKVPDSQVWQFHLACVYLDSNAKKARVSMLKNVIL